MRAKSLALLSLALGCGLVASIGITQVMAKRSAPAAIAGETDNIYVAQRDIPLNEVLSVGMLKLEQWPKDKVPPGAVSKLEEIEGRRCRTRLYAGEAILKTKLFGKGQDLGGTSSQIPKGMRVVPVRVDAVSGGGGLILPGDRVDLLAHILANPAAGIHEACTRTVLQNIKVFAVDTQTDLERVDGDGKSIQAKTISLLVTPEQAQKIALASELGQVRLVMRSPEDDSNTEIKSVTVRELLGKSDSGQLAKDAPPSDDGKPTASQEFLALLKASLQAKQAAPSAAETKPAAQAAAPVRAAPPAPVRFQMRLLMGDLKPADALFEAKMGAPDGSRSWTLVSETVTDTRDKADAEARRKALAETAMAPQVTKGVTITKDAQGKVTGMAESVSESASKPTPAQ